METKATEVLPLPWKYQLSNPTWMSYMQDIQQRALLMSPKSVQCTPHLKII